MPRFGWGNLTGAENVEWVIGSGVDLDVITDRSVDDVFPPSPCSTFRARRQSCKVMP
jgi:hypothetical protein